MSKTFRNNIPQSIDYRSDIASREKFDVSRYRSSGCSDDDIWELKKIFDLFDLNGTGKINLKRLFQLMKSMTIGSMKFKHTEACKLMKQLALNYDIGVHDKRYSFEEKDTSLDVKYASEMETADDQDDSSIPCSSESDYLGEESDSSASSDKQSSEGTLLGRHTEQISGTVTLPKQRKKLKRITFDMFMETVYPMIKENDLEESLRKCWKNLVHHSEDKDYLTFKSLDQVSRELNLNFTANEMFDMFENAGEGKDRGFMLKYDEFCSAMTRVQQGL